MKDSTPEAKRKKSFEFGKNWSHFLAVLGETQIAEAERSLKSMLEVETLEGKTFLDIGSGSGLFSLAAMRMGAKRVHSFDYDPQSVACTQEVKQRYSPNATHWVVERGDVLDEEYMQSLGQYDIVYAWGVLHHTGQMWRALKNAALPVRKGGKLFIAIYNDQGWISRIWLLVKRTYNAMSGFTRLLITIPVLFLSWTPRSVKDVLRGKPFHSWRTYHKQRGMSPWHDVVDWVGGYPFEVAKPQEILDFYRQRGYEIKRLETVRGHGCNQFVFYKADK